MRRFICCFLIGLFSVLWISQSVVVAQAAPVTTPVTAPVTAPIEVKIPPRSLPVETTKSTERRGVWMTNVDSDVLFKPEKLKVAVDQLAELNFNTIYPVSWNFGYTFYPSATALKETGFKQSPELKNRDVLAELIPQAHAKNMKVMPWFEFGFMTPESSELMMNHPEWLTNESNGKTVWMEGKEPRVWLNPFLPEVQTFMTNLVMETVNNYDVDGIQFDDHFGLPNSFGYDDYTIALYRQEHNNQAPPRNPDNAEWVKWRANKITDYTDRLVRTIKAKKPNIEFSLSPNPYDYAYAHSLQDWRTWQQRGLLDELIVQVYVSSLQSFESHLQRSEVQAAAKQIPVSIGVLSGLKGKKVPFNRIREQVKAVRNANLSGVSFFFYETLWNIAYEGQRDRISMFRRLFSP